MSDTVPVSRLRGLNVVFENDLYELARFTLQVHLARDTPTHKTRTTVHGLIGDYEYLAHINGNQARDLVTRHGLPLDACIGPYEEQQ